MAGLFSVALVVVRALRTPGRYPDRCPMVFGLSSYKFLQATARLASLLQGFNILAKIVQQLQFRFIDSIYAFIYLNLTADLDRIAGFERRIGNFSVLD